MRFLGKSHKKRFYVANFRVSGRFLQDFDGLKKGVEMTFESLMSTLKKLGIEVYGKSGDTFDPNLHNAVMHIEDENLKDGEIVDVFQKGYKIGDKIIRPAMVKSAN